MFYMQQVTGTLLAYFHAVAQSNGECYLRVCLYDYISTGAGKIRNSILKQRIKFIITIWRVQKSH